MQEISLVARAGDMFVQDHAYFPARQKPGQVHQQEVAGEVDVDDVRLSAAEDTREGEAGRRIEVGAGGQEVVFGCRCGQAAGQRSIALGHQGDLQSPGGLLFRQGQRVHFAAAPASRGREVH